MAEDNQKIEIKSPAKPINNPREVYFAENEKNILGARGFKFALGKDFSKKIKIKEKNQSPIQNNNKFKLKLDNKILPEISHYTKNTTNLFKSQSQMNINEKPNLNYVAYKEKDYNDKLTPINI